MAAVFFDGPEQERIACESRDREAARRGKQIHTKVLPLQRFYIAEDYHQKYEWKHDPYLSKTFPQVDDYALSWVAKSMGVPMSEIQKQMGARWEQFAGC